MRDHQSMPQTIVLELDFIPRYDMIANLSHYDEYYRGMDADIYGITNGKANTDPAQIEFEPYNVIHRLVSSPASLQIRLQDTDNGRQLYKKLIEQYVSAISRR